MARGDSCPQTHPYVRRRGTDTQSDERWVEDGLV
jgi:hypothetical protein